MVALGVALVLAMTTGAYLGTLLEQHFRLPSEHEAEKVIVDYAISPNVGNARAGSLTASASTRASWSNLVIF